jgi:beta-galactosidase
MYAPIDDIMAMLTDPDDTRPVILVEYLYQIRNSGGRMDRFGKLTEAYARFQGGFVWDWQDKALIAKTPKGASFYAYGGDFGGSFHNWEVPEFMTCNGIVLPDLTPKPSALEMAHVYCPVSVTERPMNNAWEKEPLLPALVIRNRCLTWDTTRFTAAYAILEDGVTVYTAPLPLPVVPAGGEAELPYPVAYDRKPNHEYKLNITICWAREQCFARAGDEAAVFQFNYGQGDFEPMETETAVPAEALAIRESASEYTLSGADFTAVFCKKTGALLSFQRGETLFFDGGNVTLSRPRCGVDAAPGWGCDALWRVADESNARRTAGPVTVQRYGASAAVSVPGRMTFTDHPGGVQTDTVWVINGDGQITLDCTIRIAKSLQHVPRAGLCFTVQSAFENLTYYGMGPGENYKDRMASARMGVFESTVEGEHFPFIPPSENGGHEACRYIMLHAPGGSVLAIRSEQPFHFDIHHYTVEDCQRAGHEHELIRLPESILHIDAAHAGIGGDMAWSTKRGEADHVPAGVYHLRLNITCNV